MKCTVNIVIVETSFILYQGLSKALLDSELSVKVTRAGDLIETERLLNKLSNSVVIINPSIALYNNKEFQILRRNQVEARWIAFAYQFFDEHSLSLFDGVINVTDSPEKIADTVKSLFFNKTKGKGCYNEKLLSEREIEVLQLLALGLSNKEIADKLNISTNTAITHRKNISQKTGIRSVSGLTIYAVVNKYITLENTI